MRIYDLWEGRFPRFMDRPLTSRGCKFIEVMRAQNLGVVEAVFLSDGALELVSDLTQAVLTGTFLRDLNSSLRRFRLPI